LLFSLVEVSALTLLVKLSLWW